MRRITEGMRTTSLLSIRITSLSIRMNNNNLLDLFRDLTYNQQIQHSNHQQRTSKRKELVSQLWVVLSLLQPISTK